jgi:hypothetical protein
MHRICGSAAAAVVAILFGAGVCFSDYGGCARYSCPGNPGYGNVNCCNVICGPPLPSPIDTPLRCYFMPRRPAWGGQQYRYRVKPQEDFCGCGPNGDVESGYAAANPALAPELYDGFAPMQFERFGQIPNSSRDLGPVAPISH